MAEPHGENRVQPIISIEGNSYKSQNQFDVYSRLWTRPALRNLCEIVFIVDSERFSAPRLIFAAASPVFEAMLTNGMRETEAQEIQIKHTDKTCWKLAFRFMYTGCIERPSRETALNILRLAHCFQMTILVDVAESYFCKHILEDTVFSSYHIGDIYSLKNLLSLCEKNLERELVFLSMEDDFKHIPFETIDEILGKKSVMVRSELDIFITIVNWANIPSVYYDEGTGNTDKVKYDYAKTLLRNLKVEKIEPWEIRLAWKYSFLRNCPGIAKDSMKAALYVADLPVAIRPYGLKNPDERKMTILFNIAENEMPNGSWNFDGPIDSPWKVDKINGRKWRLKLYLQGNETTDDNSLYLEISPDSPMSKTL